MIMSEEDEQTLRRAERVATGLSLRPELGQLRSDAEFTARDLRILLHHFEVEARLGAGRGEGSGE